MAGAFHNIWSHIANLPTDDIAIDGAAELFRERLQELTVAERDSETDMPPVTITLPDQGTA